MEDGGKRLSTADRARVVSKAACRRCFSASCCVGEVAEAARPQCFGSASVNLNSTTSSDE